MEKFFQYFKEKLSLENENLYLLRNIILNDNTLLIKQNFNFFYENKTHILNDINYFYCSLFLPLTRSIFKSPLHNNRFFPEMTFNTGIFICVQSIAIYFWRVKFKFAFIIS